MYGGTGVIIGMVVASVISAVSQSVLISQGKQSEAQYVDIAVKSGLIITSMALFAKAITTMASIG
jgi:hypothetical protein